MTAENRSVTAGKLGEAGSETGLEHDKQSRQGKCETRNIFTQNFSTITNSITNIFCI